MYLVSYRFNGDPDKLLAAYDRLMAGFPADAILLHAAVAADDGVLVVDACPSKADFEAFSTSTEFTAAIEQAGLPQPIIERHGHVHAARTANDVLVA